MAAVCDVCGKGPGFGMSVSHSHRRTHRRWNPNIQTVRTRLGGGPARPQLPDRRTHREQQVRAGVPVRDGEDVDPVDVRAVPLQGGRGGVGPALEQHGVEDGWHAAELIVGPRSRRATTARARDVRVSGVA